MSDTAVAVRTVTADELDLVKRTVANGATDAELKLFLFDCARQGVHPLDRLIHFTLRKQRDGNRKYTPITSIDFMRIRASDSGEYAGSDAALYASKDGVWSSLWVSDAPPFAALVTVWRLVQGTRCKFEAVARWSEYKPDDDFMWRKLPATMLGKCAEALALRKGFPRQLAGLYAKEELDQAGQAGVVESRGTLMSPDQDWHADIVDEATGAVVNVEGPDLEVDLPPGARLIRSVGPGAHGSACEIEFTNGERCLSWNKKLSQQADEWRLNRVPVFPDYKVSAAGNKRIEHLVPVPVAYNPDAPEEAF